MTAQLNQDQAPTLYAPSRSRLASARRRMVAANAQITSLKEEIATLSTQLDEARQANDLLRKEMVAQAAGAFFWKQECEVARVELDAEKLSAERTRLRQEAVVADLSAQLEAQAAQCQAIVQQAMAVEAATTHRLLRERERSRILAAAAQVPFWRPGRRQELLERAAAISA